MLRFLSALSFLMAVGVGAWQAGVATAAPTEEADRPKPGVEAWTLWRQGKILEAGARAEQELTIRPDDASLRQLLTLVSFVSGRYERGLGHFGWLPADSPEAEALAELVVDAYLHLDRPAAAAAAARRFSLAEEKIAWLDRRAERPLAIDLDGTTRLGFASGGPVGELLPSVAITLEGEPMLGHLDTGGTYLVTSPKVAESLGIALERIGSGYANQQRTEVLAGIAEELRLGDAVLRNVPVQVVGSLTGPLEEMVILGNNLLERFVVTWDNPGKQLVLSPKDEASRKVHLAREARDSVEIDFFLYGDHFAFARGAVGEHAAVFFVDSGLAAIDPDGNQVAMGAPATALQAWGVEPAEPGRFVRVPGALRLGPLEQEGHWIYVFPPENDRDWFGLRAPGLLAHGFLKRYRWTMDFDHRRWYFAQPTAEAKAAGRPSESGGSAEAEEKAAAGGETESEEVAGPEDAARLDEYVGSYEVAPGTDLLISESGGRLRIQAPGQPPVPLDAAGDDAFAIPLAGAKVTFERGYSGRVYALVLEQAGHRTRATRKD